MSERLSKIDMVADTMQEHIVPKHANQTDSDYILNNTAACLWLLDNYDEIKRRMQENRDYKTLILPFVIEKPRLVESHIDPYFLYVEEINKPRSTPHNLVILKTGSTTREAYDKIKKDIDPAMLRWLPTRAKYINMYETAPSGYVWLVVVCYLIPTIKENIKG